MNRNSIVRQDLYTASVAGLLFPLHERFKHHSTTSVRRWLEATQFYSKERLEDLQAQRLQTLIRHAAQQVPYYQEVFTERGIRPDTIKTTKDLTVLPFLTKSIIRQEHARLKAQNAERLISASTSGSTGEPLKFCLGMDRVSHDVAAKWRATRWWGVDIGDPEVVIWASPIELNSQDYLRRARDCLLRSTFINSTDLSEKGLDNILAIIDRKRPKMLFGSTAAIARLALHVLCKKKKIISSNLRVVFVTTEKLLEEQRRNIAKAFDCPVADGYGGRDAGFIAHECPQGGMHITAEDIIIEIIDEQGQPLPVGQAGEVVVTHLASRDFPFIRYRTGDIAVLDSRACPCGRGLPLISEIQGRSNDFLISCEGGIVNHSAISILFRDLPGIHTFKVIQETLSKIRVFIVAEEKLSHQNLDTLYGRLKKMLGQDIDIIIEEVSEIPLEGSGKHRYIVNHVTPTANMNLLFTSKTF